MSFFICETGTEFVARVRSLSPTLPRAVCEGANESLREFYGDGSVDDQRASLAQDARSAVPSETRDEAFAGNTKAEHQRALLAQDAEGRSRVKRGMSLSL